MIRDPFTTGNMASAFPLTPAPGGQQQQNTTFFSDPGMAQNVSGLLASMIGQVAPQYSQFMMNPAASPVFQSQLGGLMQSLIPMEKSATRNLQDQFRMSGGLNSGAYATAGQQLAGDLLGRRQQAAGDLLGRTYGQTLQGMMGPMNLVTQLMQALKLQESFGASQSNPQMMPFGGMGQGNDFFSDYRVQQPGGAPSSPSLDLDGILRAMSGMNTAMPGGNMARPTGASYYGPSAPVDPLAGQVADVSWSGY